MVKEYEAARHSALVLERSDRALVRVHGREPVKMVQGLVTNDLANAPAEQSVYAGMLTPKGKLLADLQVYRRGTDVMLETDRTALQNVLDNLKKYVPPLFARAEDVAHQYGVIGVYGPSARTIAMVLGPVPDAFDALTEPAPGILARRSQYLDEAGWELTVPAARTGEILEVLERAGAVRGSLETLEILRIEAGTPRWGAELDENVIPLEAGLRDRMISETKGCYTGQEVIVRVLHRGHVNWMLRGALLGQARPPARGTPLYAQGGDKPVARITSACVSPRYGQTIALCYARREVGPPADLRLDHDTDVRVVELPFTAVAAAQAGA